MTGSLTKEDNLAAQSSTKQRLRRDHNYRAYPDPEGLLSTLPAIGSVLLGVLVGLGLRSRTRRRTRRRRGCSRGAWSTSILGVLLGWWLMPINKQIWTPSFTVFTAGMGMLGLGAVFYVADVRGRRGGRCRSRSTG